MKKLLIVSVIILLATTSAFAGFRINAGVGILSNAGIGFDTGSFIFEAGYEKALPFTPFVLQKIIPLIEEGEYSFEECKKYSIDLYTGLDFGAYLRFAQKGKSSFYAGLNVKTAIVKDGENLALFSYYLEDYDNFLGVFANCAFRYEYDFDNHNSFFISAGVPLVIYAKSLGEKNDACPINILESTYIAYKLAESFEIKNGTPLVLGGFVASTIKLGYSYSF